MNFLIDPNVGYTLLVGGTVLAILALFAPGTGLLEVGAMAALVMAAYTMVQHPISVWALVVMGAAVIPLVLAVRSRKSMLLLLLSVILMLAGSLFVFLTVDGKPAVHPVVGFLVSVGAIGLLWITGRKAFQSHGIAPAHDPDSLVGSIGVAVTDIEAEGSVYAGGENWTARSENFIPAGTDVRIIRREGLTLQVVAQPQDAPSDQPKTGGESNG